MKIGVTGATGLIGGALAHRLTIEGHEVVRLRRPIDRTLLEGCDAVVHLAGENVFGRWTAAKKRRIRESRVMGTRLLSEAIAGLERPPRVLLAASAVGYYGDRAAAQLTEESPGGDDFLAQVAREWEAAAAPARQRGVRVANLRFGVVLARSGGALAKMLLPFRLGLGGPIGSGAQYFPWIALEDAVGAMLHVLATESLSGPVNVTAPHVVTQLEFVRTLARVLRRPAVLPVPPLALRLVFGREAAAFMRNSHYVIPARLVASGYRFRFATLEAALRALLAAPGGDS